MQDSVASLALAALPLAWQKIKMVFIFLSVLGEDQGYIDPIWLSSFSFELSMTSYSIKAALDAINLLAI